MNTYTNYDISDKIDKSLHSLADMVREILNDKLIIDEILEKHVVAYNKILNKKCSSRSLIVMNQNRKPIFSTFAPSEMIQSPCRPSDSIGKDPETPCIVDVFPTPTKSNRIGSKTERKRLSFDATEIKHTNPVKAITEDSNETEMHLDTSSSFLEHDDKAQYNDNFIEKFNHGGMSESMKPDENISTKSPFKNEMTISTPELKSRERKNFTVKERLKPWLFQCRPSHYIYTPNQDNPNILIRERFNPEGNAETLTSLDEFDDGVVVSTEEKNITPTNNASQPTKCDDIHKTSPKDKNSPSVSYSNTPTKFPDNLQLVVTGSEEKNRTPENDTKLTIKCADIHQIMVINPEEKCIPESSADHERKSTRKLEISRYFSTYVEEEEIFEIHKNSEESFQINENVKIVSNQPITPMKTLCTPKKSETPSLKVNKKKKTINENAAKRVTKKIINSDDKENLYIATEIKTPNTPKLKRKFVDNSEKAIMPSSLAVSDQEFVVPSKISKINDLTINNENTAISSEIMNGKDSIGTTKASIKDVMNFLPCIDNSDMDDNDSTNRTDDNFVNKKEVIQLADQFAMSALITNSNSENLSVTPAKKLVRNDSFSPFPPELSQKKTVVEVKSDNKNLKYEKNEIFASETNFIKSLTDRMKDLNPSVKHSEVSPSENNRSSSDCAVLVRKLPLHENQSANIISGSEFLLSNESNTKEYNMYALEVKNFINMLKQRKSRFSMYYHIFAEEKHELNFLSDYIDMLASVVNKIPVSKHNEAAVRSIDEFARKGLIIRHKTNLWIFEIKRDLAVWKKCIQKIAIIEDDVKRIFTEETPVTTSKYFQIWEESYKIVNKTADDMILLKEIRRPTIIQFGYEVQYLFQKFIQCLLLLGFLKNSAVDSSDKKL